MTGSGEVPEVRRQVEAAAARVGVHAGLFRVRAAPVVREMVNEELGPDAEGCAHDVELLAEAVSTGLAMRATTPGVTPAAFAEYVGRLTAATSMSADDARWALATWAAVASGGEIDPALVAVPDPVTGPHLAADGTSGTTTRRPALLAVAAVALVALGSVAVLGLAGRPGGGAVGPSGADIADRWDGAASGSSGPFASAEAFLDALPTPSTFRRSAPDRASAFADAEFLVTSDFETACADLGRALRAMEPAFPNPETREYPTGGVNRCEAQGPIASLGGAEVRALVLKIDNRVQIYVADPATG